MFSMRFLIPLVLILTAFPAVAHTEEISNGKRALIDEVIEVAALEELFQKTLDLILLKKGRTYIEQLARQGGAAVETGLSQEEHNVIYMEKMQTLQQFHDLVVERVDVKKSTKEIAYPLYGEAYNEGALREIVGFYRGSSSTDEISPTVKEYFSKGLTLTLEFQKRVGEQAAPIIEQSAQELLENKDGS